MTSRSDVAVSGWEKTKTVAEVIIATVGIAIAAIGAWFTYTFNQRQLDQQQLLAERNAVLTSQDIEVNRASSVAEFVPFLKGDSDPAQQQAAISAIYTIGYRDAAIQIARLNPSKGAIAALEFIAASDDTLSRAQALAALNAIQETGTRAQRSLSDSTLIKIQEANPPTVDGQWAVVTGGFRSREAASADSASAAQQSIPTRVVLRNRRYRTVVVFNSEAQAKAALPGIHARVRNTAYVVNWQRWCPDPSLGRMNTIICTVSDSDLYDADGGPRSFARPDTR